MRSAGTRLHSAATSNQAASSDQLKSSVRCVLLLRQKVQAVELLAKRRRAPAQWVMHCRLSSNRKTEAYDPTVRLQCDKAGATAPVEPACHVGAPESHRHAVVRSELLREMTRVV